ncbi:MAG: 50S ribosomal protein L19e [Nanoarchaeota archaeon]|nr:50S ribosomal protein L19e [Nanoarchaeota archaeon]MBU1030525.1 50S ribosomal protein L19e [Nanoarchaeota archaeon]MBU1849496.1 50S ribosomal protein L19e [Nanoarchaeota archaeon]
MKLTVQKRLAADVLRVSSKKVRFDVRRLEDIKEAITKTDIRSLVSEGVIKKVQGKETSRGRTRVKEAQKRKGLRKGPSTKKGKKTSRVSKKDIWKAKMRTQRALLKSLKINQLISQKTFTDLYRKSKGNFFRSKRHINLYLEEHNLIKKK